MLGHTLERYAGAIDPQAAKRSRTTDRARRHSGQRDRPTDGRISKRPGQSWTVPARGGKGATEFGDFFLFASLLLSRSQVSSLAIPFGLCELGEIFELAGLHTFESENMVIFDIVLVIAPSFEILPSVLHRV